METLKVEPRGEFLRILNQDGERRVGTRRSEQVDSLCETEPDHYTPDRTAGLQGWGRLQRPELSTIFITDLTNGYWYTHCRTYIRLRYFQRI